MGRFTLSTSTSSLLSADLMAEYPNLESEDIHACLRFASERLSLLALIPAPRTPAVVLHRIQAQPALGA